MLILKDTYLNLMDHLPNICKVYSLLVQQERKIVSPIDGSKMSHMSHINNVNNVSYDSTHDKEIQPESPEDQNQDQLSNSISFTLDHHKALLALL